MDMRFWQALSIHELYPLFSIEAMCTCWEITFAKLILEECFARLAPKKHWKSIYFGKNQTRAFVEA